MRRKNFFVGLVAASSIFMSLGCGSDTTSVSNSADGGVFLDGAGSIAANCGNGIIDVGETCDKAISGGSFGACPTNCDDQAVCTVDKVIGSECTASCSNVEITVCDKNIKDGCCPANCDATNDLDCSPDCGNGKIDNGETCDKAILTGTTGACPTSCNDNQACTEDKLVGGGCTVSCSFPNITVCDPSKKDGCCPPGCNSTADADCTAVCGNKILEAGEDCDKGIPVGNPGACPTSCNDNIVCTADKIQGSDCAAKCTFTPITVCNKNTSDGCCPSTCTYATDVDCVNPCGNGKLDPGEECDNAIPQGANGACTYPCPEQACFTAITYGSVANCSFHCGYTAIGCSSDSDGCCPNIYCQGTDPDC